MNRKRPSSTRSQQTPYQYLESIDSVELRERPQHHSSTPSLESGPDTPGNGDNTITTAIYEPSSRPRRIGIGTWLIIATSFVVLAASLAFLSWLWFVDRENESWRYLMFSGRATQSITLTSVLIRWAIGSLAAITTSMAASIAVEGHGIPKTALAEVSIARFTNSGPYSFKKLLLGTALKGWIRVCMVISFFLVATSQFSSTLLVVDFQLFQLISFPKHISYGYTTWVHLSDGALSTDDPLTRNDDEWSRVPVQSPIFAEYSEPGQLKDNIDDTGLSLRALLPMNSQSQRESVHSFSGMARILDCRVLCVQPKFSIKLLYDPKDSDPDNLVGRIEGNITANLSNVPQLYHLGNESITERDGGSKQYSGTFSCDDYRPSFSDQKMNWLLCSLGTTGDSFSPLSPLTNVTYSANYALDYGIRPKVLVSMTATGDQDGALFTAANTTWKHINSSTFGPWAKQFGRVRIENTDIEQDCEIQMALCFDSFTQTPIQYLNITASTNFNHTEPTSGYESQRGVYDTLAMRNQLVAVNRDRKEKSVEREILNLSEENLNRSLEAEFRKLRSLRLPRVSRVPNLCICPAYRSSTYSTSTSELVWQVFNDVLDSTGSPAFALQALYTMVFRMMYYSSMPWTTPEDDPATITTFEVVRAPQQKWGLIAVMAIVAGNVLVFLIVVFFFLYATDSSFIDNAWHTIAQISQSEDVKPLLERAKLTSDKDIEEWLRGHKPPKDKIGSIKDFFRDIGRMFSQREPEERYIVQNGVFTKFGSK